MPRQARLDAPGTLHHVMIRGIEGKSIFRDSRDRRDFVSRLGDLSKEMGTPILAWALLRNHVHLLLFSGSPGLPLFMRRGTLSKIFNLFSEARGGRGKVIYEGQDSEKKLYGDAGDVPPLIPLISEGSYGP